MKSDARTNSIFRASTAVLGAVVFFGLLGCDEAPRESRGEYPQQSSQVVTEPVRTGTAATSDPVVVKPAPKPDSTSQDTTRQPVTPPPSPPVQNAPAAANAWPRKMPIDPASGYVTSPPQRVKHPPRIIAWFPIGNSDTLQINRNIGWNIKKDGWAGFINKWVEPAIKLGFDAVQIHNPGGTRATEEMQADQFLDAKDDGVDWVSRGFVDAWKPVTQRVPVIAYLGMLPKNERFENLLKRGDRVGFLQTVTESYRLPLEAKMDIAFDAMHTVKPDGWEIAVYKLFTAMGVKTYVEPIPNVLDRGLYDANFEIMNISLERALANGEPWVPSMELLTGERIVLLAEPPKGKSWKTVNVWLPGFLKHWTSQGWSVAMNPDYCISSGTRPWDLVGPGGRPAAK